MASVNHYAGLTTVYIHCLVLCEVQIRIYMNRPYAQMSLRVHTPLEFNCPRPCSHEEDLYGPYRSN